MKKLIALLLALVMVVGLIACGAQEEAAAPAEKEEAAAPAAKEEAAPAADGEKEITVGVNLYYRRDEYYVDLESTFKSYGAEKGYNMVITDADGDVPTQISQIEDFITQGVDYILLAAADPVALIPVCQEAVDAGIPVICYDGGIEGEGVAATKVIFDFYNDGELCGQWAADYIAANLADKETVKVAILDFPASPIVCGLRAQGFKETVEKVANVEIVAIQDGKASRADSMSVMENILTANPDIDLVYGINYDTGAGAAAAIEAAGSSAVVCCNAWGKEGFEQLENNHPIIKCMAASSPITQAKDAIDAIGKLMAGETLPAETLSYSTLLTAENINEFDWESIIAMRG